MRGEGGGLLWLSSPASGAGYRLPVQLPTMASRCRRLDDSAYRPRELSIGFGDLLDE